jgi:hypothetical protein
VYAGHSRSHLNVFPRGSRPLGISRIAQRSVSTCTSEVDEAPCCRDERAQHNHAPLDATSSAPCAMAHFRADPSERPAHALATANPTAALLIRAAAGRRGDRELARDGGPRRALPHVARPSVGTAPAATARSMAARATPNGVLCLALTRGSRQDGIAGSVERSVVWASLRLACGSACGVARLDSVDANARHGVQHDSKRLERAVTDWFDRAGAGRHSPPPCA